MYCYTDAAKPLMDIVSRVANDGKAEASGSLLLLGPPGVGECMNPFSAFAFY